MRILLVNEEAPTNTALSLILANDGHRVQVATSGHAALEAFHTDPFPIAIVDVNLSDMSGIMLLKKIKQVNEDTQVIMMTGFALMETAIEALHNGAYDYLIKNVEDLRMISVVVNRAAERLHFLTENRALAASVKAYHEELQNDHKELDMQAMMDLDSGLRDERYFRDVAEAELKRSKRHGRSCSVLMLRMGPGASSDSKQQGGPRRIASIVRSQLRRTDILVRYDERNLAVLLPETPADGAGIVRSKLLDALETDGAGRSAALRIEIAVFPEDGLEVGQLVAKAKGALMEDSTV